MKAKAGPAGCVRQAAELLADSATAQQRNARPGMQSAEKQVFLYRGVAAKTELPGAGKEGGYE